MSAGQHKVTPLHEGQLFATKRMEASAGIALPRHKASVESVLVVTEGRCIVRFADAEHVLALGDSFVVPADAWHQVVADPEFKAVHVMPKEIRFQFAQ